MRYATTDRGPYLTCKCTGDDADIACTIVALQNYSSGASGLANARDAAGGTYFCWSCKRDTVTIMQK